MASYLTQIRALVWRNLLVKLRGWKRSILEILSSVLLVGVMMLISRGVETNTAPAVSDFIPHNFSLTAFAPHSSRPILASPDLPFTRDVMDYVTGMLNVKSAKIVPHAVTSSEMDEEYRKRPDSTEVGIEFRWRNVSGKGPEVYGYVLRVPHEMFSDVTAQCTYREGMEKCWEDPHGLSSACPGNQALTSGLLSLQWSVETALIQVFKDKQFKPPDLQIQMMPLPAFRPDATHTQILICISMVIAMAPLAYFVTATMVTERKTRSKVMLRSMGLNDSAFWITWWLVYMATVVLISLLATLVVGLGGFFSSSGLGFFFVLVMLYGSSLLCLAFLVSIFFTTARIAGLVVSLSTVLFGLLYLAVGLTRPFAFPLTAVKGMSHSAVPFGVQVFLGALSPLAFALGLDQITFDHEENIPSTILGGHFTVLAAILILIFDTLLYGILALYLEKVIPNQFRLRLKPWFFFTPSYWRCRSSNVRDNDVIPTDTPQGPHIEPVLEGMEEFTAIRIRDLSRQFTNDQKELVYGLNGLDLDIYEGQITCILGHPGAGKTTLMNILGGVMRPTCGTAFVYDLNAPSTFDHEDLTSAVAFCPQRNVILNELTPEEHLYVAGLIRGIPSGDLQQLITECLADVHLEKQRKTLARDLSGCQRRRLSLAVTLLGNTKVVLLDEPTLGMAPEERRHVWKLLHSKKAGRVILVTTAHMDEADFFADRKAVLSCGRLRCVGSSNFLKHQFGVGYNLNLTVRPATSTDRILRAVRSLVRGASLQRREDDKLTITIPPLHNAKLTALFKRLESKERGADYLGISQYNISMTTLNQVFWKMEDEVFRWDADEEEAGNIFISPLLTPSSEDTFANYGDDQRPESHRGSMYPDISRANSMYPDISRANSMYPAISRANSMYADISGANSMSPGGRDSSPLRIPSIHITDFDSSSRRASAAYSRLQSRHPSMHEGEAGGSGHHLASALSRRLSSLFANKPHVLQTRPKSTSDFTSMMNQASSSNGGGGGGGGSGGNVSDGDKPRRSSLFKWHHKDRSKSLAGGGSLQKSHTSHQLGSLSQGINGVEVEKPSFLGSSMEARRATVAALKDFRRSMTFHGNLSGLSNLSALGDDPSLIQDPLAKLNRLDTFEQSRRSSITDISSVGLPSVSSSIEDTASFSATDNHNGDNNSSAPDPEKAYALPPKIGEVLANLEPPARGTKLDLARLAAMLKVRAVMCLREKCALLQRVMIPVLLTLAAVGLFYATRPLNPPPVPPPEELTTHLFGINRLVYNNQSGDDLDYLLSIFKGALGGPEFLAEHMAEPWNSSMSLESLLGVRRKDGLAYKMYYNATCPLALPHLTSFISHVTRKTLVAPHANSSNNETKLADQMSAILKPWPVLKAPDHWRFFDWVPVAFLGLALILTPAAYSVNMLKERKNNIRRYLGVVGVGRMVYYGSAFIVDVVELFIPATFLVVICIVSQMTMFEEEGAVACLVILVFLSVPAGVLFSYVVSFAFRRRQTCLLIMPLFVALVSVGCFFLVHFLDGEDTKTAATILHYIFCVLWPPYIRFGGFHYIAKVGGEGRIHPSTSDYFQFDSNIDICFIMLVLDILILACVVLFLDTLTFRSPTVPSCRRGSVDIYHRCTDESVKKEMQRVQDLKKDTEKARWPWLVVEKLSKVFTKNSRQLRAVNCTTFALQAGDVLGLLGPNGSGKSTLFDVLLGVTPPSGGEVHFESRAADSYSTSDLCGKMGYCPQENILWDSLTVDQHINLLGNIRGISEKDLDAFRNSLYHDLDLEIYRSQSVSDLSVCERRKLSFAMSMLGRQDMMLLDEPSLGMDPRSRKNYWDAVSYFIKGSGRSAIINTHCVEEAQVICSHLAIMVNGQLRCVGTQEDLQMGYEKTYTLEVSLRAWDGDLGPQRMEMLIVFLRELFPGIRLTEQFQERAVFTVPFDSPDFSLAKTFDTLESLKRNLDLEDFTFSRSTFEQMFLELSRAQLEGESQYITKTEANFRPSSPASPSSGNTTAALNLAAGNQLPADGAKMEATVTTSTAARDVEVEGGASCENSLINNEHAAVGVSIEYDPEDGQSGVGGASMLSGGVITGAEAAAPPVKFSLEGVDNLAYQANEADQREPEQLTAL